VLDDLHVAARGLWRAKTFTGTAVFTLALGIAGATVMFTLVQGVLLRPLPVHEQDRLILAWKEVRTGRSAKYPFGNTEIEAVAAASQLLEKAAGVTRNGVGRTVMVDNGVSGYANVADVTGGFFDVLRIDPVLGRTLMRSDDNDGAEKVIVLSSGFWQRRYGGSRDVIGRRVTLDEQRFTIAGVMPPDVDYPSGVEVWRPTGTASTDGPFGDAVRREVNLIARLRPGVTIERATAEIVVLSEQLEKEIPGSVVRGLLPIVRSFPDVVIGDLRRPMLALFGAVALVLLIACANVANLLLMRGEGRRTELAVRAALGAGRGRIVRQVFAESIGLALLAGVAGLGVSWWGLQTLLSLMPDGLPRVESIRLDETVALFSIAVVFLTALLSGLAPVLVLTRVDLLSSLHGVGRGATDRATGHGRRTLVVAQAAVAITVLAAAGLLIRSTLKLQAIDLGLPVDRLVLLDLYVPPAKTERHQHAHFLDEVMAQLEGVPAISAATPVNLSPFSGQGWDLPRFVGEAQDANQAAANPSLNLESIHPNYFETFGVPIVRGRAFSAADREGTALVAIVSEDVAARTWPGQDPVGKRLKMGTVGSADPWYTIVGIAAPTRYRELAAASPTLYLPAAQFQMTATMFVLRTTASLELITSVVRDRLRAVDRDVQLMRAVPFTEMLDRPLARPRFNAFLLSIFGLTALLLTAVGLYAVMASYVGQRDREIALRLALGATANRVRRFVLGETIRLAGVGALIGVAAAAATSRLLRGMLYEVDPLDPLALTAAALLLIVASLLASYVPVRRATRVDAIAMLRNL
jgi:putative ABC transport system permease protein